MFLYFHEAKMIVGFNPHVLYKLFLKNRDEFDINDEREDDHWFSGWEREENEDGTFYLVFIQENKKYYLQGSNVGCKSNYLFQRNNRHKLSRLCGNIIHAQKLIFGDEGTITYFDKPNRYLRIVKAQKYYLVEESENDGVFSNKVCLTETSNMNNSYVLK
jgi:hypothetical protein